MGTRPRKRSRINAPSSSTASSDRFLQHASPSVSASANPTAVMSSNEKTDQGVPELRGSNLLLTILRRRLELFQLRRSKRTRSRCTSFNQRRHRRVSSSIRPPRSRHTKSRAGAIASSTLSVSAGAAAPINSLAHKLGSQSFLPETLDRECGKSAAILRSFCTHESSSGVIDPTKEKPKNRVIVTIPPNVISKAVGLAIFTTLRAGFQVSGATGSVARWIMESAVRHPGSFRRRRLSDRPGYLRLCLRHQQQGSPCCIHDTRVSLGSDLAVVAGPYGAAVQRGRDETDKKATATSNIPGDAHPLTAAPEVQPSTMPKLDAGDSKRRSLSASAFKPVFSYVKSRGFYAGIQVDGTVVVERKDANASFYGASVTVQQILQGQFSGRDHKTCGLSVLAGSSRLSEELKRELSAIILLRLVRRCLLLG
ncbi:DUF500 domain protein [Metarhizium rileyi]|uniref:DUF500 domain protein n=1 Tax=Metarhizium rileyi (strain RCEF 4871) TaxID=1649241 RepID=A0A166Z950_METRR|nr:DUF500 domain protein [Metarhizium rileyi RCEF 4871]